MNNVVKFPGSGKEVTLRFGGDGPTIPPMDPLEPRVAKLEALAEKTVERLGSIERDLAVLNAHGATKEDLHKAINDQTWKLITWTTGLGAALVGITFYIARAVH